MGGSILCLSLGRYRKTKWFVLYDNAMNGRISGGKSWPQGIGKKGLLE